MFAGSAVSNQDALGGSSSAAADVRRPAASTAASRAAAASRPRRVLSRLAVFFGFGAPAFWVTPGQVLRRRVGAAVAAVLALSVALFFLYSPFAALRFFVVSVFAALLLGAGWFLLRAVAAESTPVFDAGAPESPGPARLVGRLWAPADAEPIVGPVSGRPVLGFRQEVQVLVESKSLVMRLLGRHLQWRTLSSEAKGLGRLWVSSAVSAAPPAVSAAVDPSVWERLSGGVEVTRRLASAAAPQLAPLFAALPSRIASRVVAARLVEFAVPQGVLASPSGFLRASHQLSSPHPSSPVVADLACEELVADSAPPRQAAPDAFESRLRAPARGLRRRARLLGGAAFVLWLAASSVEVFATPGTGRLVFSPQGDPLLGFGSLLASAAVVGLCVVLSTYLRLVACRERVSACADELDTASHIRADLFSRLSRMTEAAVSSDVPAATAEAWLEDVSRASLRLWGGPPRSEGVGEFPYDEDLEAARSRFSSSDPSQVRAVLLERFPSLRRRAALSVFDAMDAAVCRRTSWAYSAMVSSAAEASRLLSSPAGRLLSAVADDLVLPDTLAAAAEKLEADTSASGDDRRPLSRLGGVLSAAASRLRSRPAS